MRNGIVVFILQSGIGENEEGALVASGSTIVLRAYGAAVASQLKGYYTEYDIETDGTPEQFIRMSNFTAMRVNADMVPDEVKELIP